MNGEHDGKIHLNVNVPAKQRHEAEDIRTALLLLVKAADLYGPPALVRSAEFENANLVLHRTAAGRRPLDSWPRWANGYSDGCCGL